MRDRTLGQLAEHVAGQVVGDPETMIASVATLENAEPGQITFLNNRKYLSQVKDTRASAIIVAEELQANTALLITENPYYALMQVIVLLHGHRKHKKIGISRRASVSKTAKIGSDCHVHDFAVISDDVQIGDNCVIYPGVFIGPETVIGNDCIIYPGATVYDKCIVGSGVIIHANASVGQDGFGFAVHKGVHHKIPQIGRVVIEDNVEIGASCSIQRGTLEDTVIGEGSKIGDNVTIGHGTRIGPYCLLVPQVGVAGSVTMGHHCMLGGQAGVAGHIKIGNMVTIAAQSGVGGNVPDGATLFGAPAIEASNGKRAYLLIEQLPDMRKKLRAAEKRIKKLEETDQ